MRGHQLGLEGLVFTARAFRDLVVIGDADPEPGADARANDRPDFIVFGIGERPPRLPFANLGVGRDRPCGTPGRACRERRRTRAVQAQDMP